MRWEKENPDIMQATKEFVHLFQSVPDPIVDIAKKAETEEARIAWCLLGCALFQEISFPTFRRVFGALFEAYPQDRLWEFPLPEEKMLLKISREALGKIAWNLGEQVPGIFWSVGAFVRHHRPLADWITSRDVKGIWRDLGEIHFMGKQAYRPKAIYAIKRLTSPVPLGLGLCCSPSEAKCPMPFTMGCRRWIGFVGPGKALHYSEMEEEKKQKLGRSLYSALAPGNEMAAAHALQFFLEDGTTDFICREHTEGCTKCPLAPHCCKSLLETKLYDT